MRCTVSNSPLLTHPYFLRQARQAIWNKGLAL